MFFAKTLFKLLKQRNERRKLQELAQKDHPVDRQVPETSNLPFDTSSAACQGQPSGTKGDHMHRRRASYAEDFMKRMEEIHEKVGLNTNHYACICRI